MGVENDDKQGRGDLAVSNIVQGAAWKYAPVAGSELLVLVALADNADDDGVAFPSYAHLAQKTRLSERQVKRIVKSLVDQKLVTVRQHGGKVGGHNVNNIYVVEVEAMIGGVMEGQIRGDILTPLPGFEEQSGVSPGVVRGDIAMAQEPPRNHHQEETTTTSTLDERVQRVFDHFVVACDPRTKTLDDSRRKLIVKALSVVEGDELLTEAIDGLIAYVKKPSVRDKSLSLSRVFKTRPNGDTLIEQIEFWASQAPKSVTTNSDGIPLRARNHFDAMVRLYANRENAFEWKTTMERLANEVATYDCQVIFDENAKPLRIEHT